MYKSRTVKPLEETELFCNKCGKKIVVERGILKEDIFEASKEWGYFSKRDLEVHQFILCEDCYDEMVSTFKIPIEVQRKKEVL